MPALEDWQRGLFISFLVATAVGTLFAAGPAQRRYVATVTKTGHRLQITTPYFLTSTKIDVRPSEITLSSLSMRDLLGREDPDAAVARTARDTRPMETRALFSIVVHGRKLMVDSEGMAPEERRELQRVLGVWRRIAPGPGERAGAGRGSAARGKDA